MLDRDNAAMHRVAVKTVRRWRRLYQRQGKARGAGRRLVEPAAGTLLPTLVLAHGVVLLDIVICAEYPLRGFARPLLTQAMTARITTTATMSKIHFMIQSSGKAQFPVS
jgi:hypothetical protein